MLIKTEDPGVQGVHEAVEEYTKRNPGFEKAIRLYGAVMEAQQEALEKIDCSIRMDESEVERKLLAGKPLLDGLDIEVDSQEFRGLVAIISEVIDVQRKDGVTLSGKLLGWSGIEPGHIDQTRECVVSGGMLEPGDEWTEEEARLASNILWETFSPFYRKCGSILEINLDHSLWQRGFCPICGGRPLIGKFRGGDGLWLLECSLCHTQWNVKRASCPFCEGGSEGSLNYLYLDGNNSRKAQYCVSCKVYLKTIDLRDSEGKSLLPLEDIITMELDQAARGEGLKPASGYSAQEG